MNDAESPSMPPEPPANHCPQCGAPVAAGALGGLCPACLLKQGAAADTITGGGAPFTPPTVEEISAKFPQLEILSLVGKGGMGAVYKARQKQLERFVALKILPPGIGGGGHDAAFAERFAREARALAKMHHANIVALYEFGEADGLFYFLMEFVDGVNLRQLLNTGRIAPKEALAIVPQICDALQFAHDRGIVHRDIKPENILLNKQGEVKIADFGVAKIMSGETTGAAVSGAVAPASAHTEAGKVLGTPQYMAPEQISSPQEVDNRADIYSLGVVFYQMLTGELPKGKFEAPSKKVQIDVRLDEVVLRALEKEPELRYQQASIFKTQVETIAHTPVREIYPQAAQASPPTSQSAQSRKAAVTFLVRGIYSVGAFAALWPVIGLVADFHDPDHLERFVLCWAWALGIAFVGKLLSLALGNSPGAAGAPAPRAQSGCRRHVIATTCVLFAVVCGLIIFHTAQRANPATAEVRYRVFEADAALVDKLIPFAQRKTGAVAPGFDSQFNHSPESGSKVRSAGDFSVSTHGAEITDSQVAEVAPATLDALLHGIGENPGLLADHSRSVSSIWWKPGLADGWSYSKADGGLLGGGGANAFLGFRRKDGQDEIRIDCGLTHNIDLAEGPGGLDLTSKLLYEGKAPGNDALVFLVPFFRKDGSTHYLVVAFEVKITDGQPTAMAVAPDGAPVEGLAQYEFGPVTERVLKESAEGGFNMRTGNFIPYNTDSNTSRATWVDTEWQERFGVDIAGNYTNGPAVGFANGASAEVGTNAWEQTPLDAMRDFLATHPGDARNAELETEMRRRFAPDSPAEVLASRGLLEPARSEFASLPVDSWKTVSTRLFRTRRGDVGLLQILGLATDPEGIHVRWKIMRSKADAAGKPSAAPLSPEILAQQPQLRFLAWQDENISQVRWRAWHANGSPVEDKGELKLIDGLHPAFMDVTDTAEGKKNPRFLMLWFSHPGIDADSFKRVALFDAEGKLLPPGASGSTSYDSKPPDDSNGNLGWIDYNLSPGNAGHIPAAVTIRLEYSIGPWMKNSETPADYKGAKSLGDHVMLGSIGQDAKGSAFISITRSDMEKPDTQYSFVALLHDGRELAHTGFGASGFPNLFTETSTFPVALAEVKGFRLRSRPVKTVEFKNVPLQQPAQNEAAATFGPVIERTLKSPAVDRVNSYIDLDTGNVIALPATVDLKDNKAIWNWAAKHGVDAVANTDQDTRGLEGFGLQGSNVPDSEWDQGTPGSIGRAAIAGVFLDETSPTVEMSHWVIGANTVSTGPRPRTFAFRTREEHFGVLQLLEISDEPGGYVKFRYKMLQAAAAPAPQPATSSGTLILSSTSSVTTSDSVISSISATPYHGFPFGLEMRFIAEFEEPITGWTLDDNKSVRYEPSSPEIKDPALDKVWMEKNHPDVISVPSGRAIVFMGAIVEIDESSMNKTADQILKDYILANIPVGDHLPDWNEISAKYKSPTAMLDAYKLLVPQPGKTTTLFVKVGTRPGTYLFRTLGGKVGRLQIGGYTQDLKGMEVSYRIIGDRPDKAAAGLAIAPPTVTMLDVERHSDQGVTAWQPDGTPLSDEVSGVLIRQDVHPPEQNGHPSIVVSLLVKNPPPDEVTQGSWSASFGEDSYSPMLAGWDEHPELQGMLYRLAANFSKEHATTNIRFAIPVKPRRDLLVLEGSPLKITEKYAPFDKEELVPKFTVEAAVDRAGSRLGLGADQPIVRVRFKLPETIDYDWDWDVLLFDRDGKRVYANQWPSQSSDMHERTWEFNLPGVDRVSKIILQGRSYGQDFQWTEFKDVPLQPKPAGAAAPPNPALDYLRKLGDELKAKQGQLAALAQFAPANDPQVTALQQTIDALKQRISYLSQSGDFVDIDTEMKLLQPSEKKLSAIEIERSNPSRGFNAPFTELKDAAFEIQRSAVRDKIPAHTPIPEKDWPQAVRDLGALEVYTDRVNVVMVMRRSLIQQYGLYITLPISSYVPRSGGEWAFRTMAPDVYDFARTMTDQPMVFGPVIERTVPNGIDFDTGNLSQPPGPVFTNATGSFVDMEKLGMDASRANDALFILGMKAKAVKSGDWDKMKPAEIAEALGAEFNSKLANMDMAKDANAPATYIFQTQPGAMGMVQILGSGNAGLKIRYRLVRVPGDAPPSQEANAPAQLPPLDAKSSEGLVFKAAAVRPDYNVGDRLFVSLDISNPTDKVKPIGWSSAGDDHFTLMKGDKLEGIMPKITPRMKEAFLVASGSGIPSEKILYLPPGKSVNFLLDCGVAEKAGAFRQRIGYTPLSSIYTNRDVVRPVNPKDPKHPWGDDVVVSGVFEYKVTGPANHPAQGTATPSAVPIPPQ